MNQNYYNQYRPVVPSDSDDGPFAPGLGGTPGIFEALYFGTVGVGGTVAIVDESGTVTTFTEPIPGVIFEVHGRRVNATGTTVTDIVALRQV